jgi:hypothetical protein
MDAQEIRNLQEAYSQVYELDEISDRKVAAVGRRRQANVDKAMSSDEYISDKPGATQKLATKISQKSRFDNLNKKRDRKKLQQEQVDLYDIIFSHLLDEGYAETPEAAEAIMVNMSEDWRESIVEEVLDEELTGARYKRAMEKAGGREALGKIPMTLAARVAVGREGQPLEVARKDPRNSVRTTTKGPTKRGGSGFKRRTKSDFQGVDDTVGSGNKAARRAGKKVKDTSDDL